MVKKIQDFFKITFLSLWNGGGLIGRLIAIPIGLIFFILLLLLYLFKLTFIWAYRLLKIFLNEFIFFLKKCAVALDGANDILDEVIQKRVIYHIKKIGNKLIETPFAESKMPLTKNWFPNFIWFGTQAVFWGFSSIIMFVITFSAILHFVASSMLGIIDENLTHSLILKLTIFFPILIRMIRLKTIKINQPEFWTTDLGVISDFKKRHWVYIVLAIIMLGGAAYMKIN